MTYRAVYPVTDAIIEWLSNNMLQVQEATFNYYRRIFNLVQVVSDAEEGKIPRFAALSAIRDYNEENGTAIEYDEVKNLDSTYIFSDVAEWVVFTDNPNAIILSGYEDPEEALTYAPDDVEFIILWEVENDAIIVYRSPFIGLRAGIQQGYSAGEDRGDTSTYVLPPEIEASLHEMRLGELFEQKGGMLFPPM